MAPRSRHWPLVALFWLMALSMASAQSANGDDYGLGFLNNLIENDPESICQYVTCHIPVEPENCTQGTIYVEKVTQFGCCGACVQFKKLDESCTGSIDPKYCGGYGIFPPNTNPYEGSCNDSSKSAIDSSVDMHDNIIRSSWCGYNLACGNMGICEINPEDKGCAHVQREYDRARRTEGRYFEYRDDYRWRPTCTPSGFYDAKQCKGPVGEKRCICVDPDGNRLYGDAFYYQRDLFETMNCKCSRRVWELKQQGQESVTLHCTPNGNYERLQCEDGWCYCIDPLTATPYGARLPEGTMWLLDCYNKTQIGKKYLRRCESEYHAHMELFELMHYKGVEGPSTRLSCDADGSYSGEQCTVDGCNCYDKYNKLLATQSGGGCQCRRDIEYNKRNNINIDIACEINTGRYKEIQTRGQYAFCVDEDGVRSGPLVYSHAIDKVSCKMALGCQGGSNYDPYCKDVCTQCDMTDYVKYQVQ